MLVVRSMDVRDNFKSFCEKVFNGETLVVARPKNENVVVISESEYNDLIKTKKNAEYLAMLNESMKDVEAGNVVVKTFDELKTYEK